MEKLVLKDGEYQFVPYSELEGKQMFLVCDDTECLHIPMINVDVGNMTHNFCCENGFEKSLKQFQESL